MFLKELYKLTRFEHAIMLSFAVFLSEIIVLGHVPQFSLIILFSLLVPAFSEMGSFSLNDYFDVETDRLNKKNDRPLVTGTISLNFALYFSLACHLISIILAFFINMNSFLISLVFNFLAVLYNYKLKDLPLIGNIYIALTMGIPFIFGALAISDSVSTLAISLFLLGFVAGLAREIIKSAQDMEGDKKARNSQTLPILIGKQKSIAIACLLYLAFIFLSIIPFQLGISVNLISLSLVGFSDVLIIYIIYLLLTNPDSSYKLARNLSLVSFLIGMVGILAGI
jgi:4-hydroxybenzoate polyprenyltransferase